ncbi:MAG: hypothetical protein FK733_15770 [Asgard group archaeon]|nr:hypothetical protein [Asgard group archaeon]
MSEELILDGLRIRYKIMSVKRLQALQNDIDKLEQEGKISQNKVLRYYIGNFKFDLPENFPNAKSIIVVARENKLAKACFHYNGSKIDVMIPPNYCQKEDMNEKVSKLILEKVIMEPGYKIEPTRSLHLKLLHVRSGLGRYGRNNICYVDEFGSLAQLYCFFTDYEFEEVSWEETKMLDRCENCTICIDKCPTKAISKDNFVIDVERCLPLYNEIQGEFPDWITPDAHNALMGCMKCQMFCPENKIAMKNFERLEDITEEETIILLEGKGDEKIINRIGKKLRMFDSKTVEYYLPVLKRNLEVLIKTKF